MDKGAGTSLFPIVLDLVKEKIMKYKSIITLLVLSLFIIENSSVLLSYDKASERNIKIIPKHHTFRKIPLSMLNLKKNTPDIVIKSRTYRRIDIKERKIVINNNNNIKLLSANVYPVPAANIINVKVNGIESEDVMFEIYSMNGEIILMEKIKNIASLNMVTVDISHIKTGVYYFRIVSEDNAASGIFSVIR